MLAARQASRGPWFGDLPVSSPGNRPSSELTGQRGSKPRTTTNGLLSVESTVLPASSVTWTR